MGLFDGTLFRSTEDLVANPIFFIGMGRSGTTILFESFARHPRLGTRFNIHASLPSHPTVGFLIRLLDNRMWSIVGQKQQHGDYSLSDRFAPRPVEEYDFWDRLTGVNFSRSFLRDVTASPESARRIRDAIAEIVRYQGRDRFTTKFTGPPRIGYLASVFPDAQFVHVVRDGRAVVDSLLRVGFWREGGGLEEPWWEGGLDEEDLRVWREADGNPAVLAALQWRAIMEAAAAESGELGEGQYREVRYEDFVDDPHGVLDDLYDFCALPGAASTHRYMDRRVPELRNMNFKYRENLSAGDVERMTEIMSPQLARYGYDASDSATRTLNPAG